MAGEANLRYAGGLFVLQRHGPDGGELHNQEYLPSSFNEACDALREHTIIVSDTPPKLGEERSVVLQKLRNWSQAGVLLLSEAADQIEDPDLLERISECIKATTELGGSDGDG